MTQGRATFIINMREAPERDLAGQAQKPCRRCRTGPKLNMDRASQTPQSHATASHYRLPRPQLGCCRAKQLACRHLTSELHTIVVGKHQRSPRNHQLFLSPVPSMALQGAGSAESRIGLDRFACFFRPPWRGLERERHPHTPTTPNRESTPSARRACRARRASPCLTFYPRCQLRRGEYT